MMIPDADYRIVLKDMPPRGAGFVREDPDGYYTIVLNSRLTHERQAEAAQHEIWHIDHNRTVSRPQEKKRAGGIKAPGFLGRKGGPC